MMKNQILKTANKICILLLIFGVMVCFDKKPEKPTIKFVFYENANPALQSILMRKVSLFYGVAVTKDISQKLPKEAYYAPRMRYRADVLLLLLDKQKSTPGNKIIGFTNRDISCTKDNIYDYGIFGLGYMPGNACVVSSFRLKGDSTRCLQTCLHELGHTFGLDHCPNKKCFMADAEGRMIKNSPDMCKLCRAKIKL